MIFINYLNIVLWKNAELFTFLSTYPHKEDH